MATAHPELQRRLTTVLFADVVGYTRLTELDETGTHLALRRALACISELIDKHGGVVAHYAGDAVLAEFSSVLNGLNCAVEIQRAITALGASEVGAATMRFRIGVNVGDVICDDGEIYGDTVNTAVRLQSMAEPGGICISEAVRNAIGRQLPIAYEFVGEERLKNLSMPVRAYRVLLDTYVDEAVAVAPSRKPSVAIMPFDNLGGLEWDADSLTEDLIRELSRFRGLEVVAHSSSFAYKGTYTNVQQLGQELGVEYVVEGHVRHASDRIRVNVQLVSAISGRHIWSELYERVGNDEFDVRDEIIRLCVAAIAGRVHVTSGEAAKHRPVSQLHAFEHVLRGQSLVGKGQPANARARSHYQRALALEPGNARALSGIALSHIDDWWNGPGGDAEDSLSRSLAAARGAYGADARDSKVHWVLGLVHCLRSELRQAARLINRAKALNPNDADGYAADALLCLNQDAAQGMSRAIAMAMMLNPFPPAWYHWLQGLVYLASGEPSDGRLALLEALEQNPNLHVSRIALVLAYVELADTGQARIAASALKPIFPNLSAAALIARVPANDARQVQLRRVLDAAGF